MSPELVGVIRRQNLGSDRTRAGALGEEEIASWVRSELFDYNHNQISLEIRVV